MYSLLISKFLPMVSLRVPCNMFAQLSKLMVKCWAYAAPVALLNVVMFEAELKCVSTKYSKAVVNMIALLYFIYAYILYSTKRCQENIY